MTTKRRTAAATGLVIGFVVAFVPIDVQAQRGRGQVEEGNRLYEEGRFPEAHARYLEALRQAPGNPLIRFNEGNALYQSQEFERALEAYGEVIGREDSGLGPQAWYNLGNALVRQEQLADALEAYKQALRRNPTDVDAKHNLELVLRQMEKNDQSENDEDQSNEDQKSQDQENREGSDGGDQNQQNPGDPTDDQDGESDQPGRPDDREGQGQPNPDPGDGEGSGGGAQSLPPGHMTREEAERLLQAVQEDPGEVDRQGAQPRGRRPRKDW